MKRPAERQVKSEATKLATMQPKVRHFTAFGDDNRAAISAQIEVLENDMSVEDIEDRADNEIAAEEELWTGNQKESALQARQWMDGDEKESPSKSWQGLVS